MLFSATMPPPIAQLAKKFLTNPTRIEVSRAASTNADITAFKVPVKSRQKRETLVVYGEDPCPQEHDGAIVVCARKPASERYRIPKELRKKKENEGSQGWGSRVETME